MNFDSIHNYYEPLVLQRILDTLVAQGGISDEDYLQDVACLALNRLPARYVRHDVDMAFFLTTEERAAMERSVHEAVREASEYVAAHRNHNGNGR